MESVNDLRSRPDMIGMRVRTDVEIEVILRHADRAHIGDDLILFALAIGRAWTYRITEIGTIGRL